MLGLLFGQEPREGHDVGVDLLLSQYRFAIRLSHLIDRGRRVKPFEVQRFQTLQRGCAGIGARDVESLVAGRADQGLNIKLG